MTSMTAGAPRDMSVTIGDRIRPVIDTRWALLAFPPLLYGLLFTVVRPLNEIPYVIVLACAIGCCIGVGYVARLPGQLAIVLLGIVYLLCSFAQVLPKAWTIYYDQAAALRHWIPIPAVMCFTGAFYVLFRRYRELIITHALKLALLVFAIRAVGLVFEPDPSFYDEFLLRQFTLYSPNNDTTPVLLLLFIAASRGNTVRPYQLLLLLAVLPFCSSLGTMLAGLIALGLLFVRNRRLALGGLLAALCLFLAIAPFFYSELFDLDGNTGVRAIFWRDVQLALVQTHGIGVGYGTEWITNWFGDVGRLTWYLTPEDADDRLFISNHSAFYDISLRLGVLGLTAFLWSMVSMVKSSGSKLAAPACGMALVSAAFVPALTAVDTQFAMSLLFAWVLVERDVARSAALPGAGSRAASAGGSL